MVTRTQNCPPKPVGREWSQREPELPVIEADDLFMGRAIVLIEFNGERYQLRRTRNGKLILTK